MVKMLVGLVSSVVSLLVLQIATFSLGPEMVSPQCMHPWCLSVCPNLFFLDTSQIGLGPPPPQCPHFNLIIRLKAQLQLHSEVDLGGQDSDVVSHFLSVTCQLPQCSL